MLRPDYKEFSRLAREATLVPVVKSVAADLLTPVSAFLAIAPDEPDAFLLESVERGEQIGRYTFLGARPYMQVRAEGGNIVVQRGKHKEERQGSAIQVVKELLRQHRPAIVPGLPPFTAGAVGYFAYDAVRQLENIGRACEGRSFPSRLRADVLRPLAGVRSPASPDSHHRQRRRIARESATGL